MKKGLTGVVISLLLALSVVFAVLYVSSVIRYSSREKDLQASLDERERQLSELDRKNSSLSDRIDNLNQDLAERNKLIEELRAESGISSFNDSVSQEKSYDYGNPDPSDENGKKTGQDNGPIDRSDAIAAPETESSLPADQFSEMTSSMKKKDDQIASLTAENLEQADRISSLNASLDECRLQISALLEEKQNNAERIEELTASLVEKDADLQKLNGELSQKDQFISDLSADLENRNRELEVLRSGLSPDTTASPPPEETKEPGHLQELRSDGLEAELAEKDSRISVLEEDLADRDARIDALTAAVSNREGQIEALKADVIKRAGDNAAIENELAEKEEQIVELQSRLEILTSERETFESQKQQMKQWFIRIIAAASPDDQFSSAPADFSMRFRIRSADNPNVRSEPGTSGKVIGHASASAEYDVLDVSPGIWLKIRLENGKIGWISSKMGILSELMFPFETELP